MKEFRFEDCYCLYTEHTFTIGNSFIERKLNFYKGIPYTEYVINKRSGFKWCNSKSKVSMLYTELACDKTSITVNSYSFNNYGLSSEHLCTDIIIKDENIEIKLIFSVFPSIPFITSKYFIKGSYDHCKMFSSSYSSGHPNGIENNYELQENSEYVKVKFDSIDSLSIENIHLKVEVIKLIDSTDKYDYLLDEHKLPIYHKAENSFEGNILVIDDYLNEEGLMLVKESPTPLCSINRNDLDFYLKPREYVQVLGSGIDFTKLSKEYYTPSYGSSVGVGGLQDLKAYYKKLYKNLYCGDATKNLFIMSNTWGDRSQDSVICNDFMLKELETAYELGIDIVQIDDGWQKGITANSKLSKGGVWEGYYSFDNNFWDININKFPDGFEPLVELAKSYGIKLALWFSPDSSRDFINWEKDVTILLNYYNKYDICYFKLDGIKIRNKLCEINLINLLTKVSKESNNNVSFNMDITAESRFGYLYEKQFGTIFVENRYTDWGNYYPHNTLKNLWCLSKLMPANKFLFEVLNNKRNINNYADPLAPIHYSIDYIFASVMISNPLIWMEMSNLEEEDKRKLSKIIKVYKQYRKEIFNAEIIPIGDMPDGCNFTGFQIKNSENFGFLLLFKEKANSNEYVFKLDGLSNNILKYDYLYSNVNFEFINLNRIISSCCELTVNFQIQRSFVFAKYWF